VKNRTKEDAPCVHPVLAVAKKQTGMRNGIQCTGAGKKEEFSRGPRWRSRGQHQPEFSRGPTTKLKDATEYAISFCYFRKVRGLRARLKAERQPGRSDFVLAGIEVDLDAAKPV
jgi:hypothetical protein